MRKTVAAAAIATILLGASQLSASAAVTAIPTDVQISWADISKEQIRITWKDAGEANFVDWEIEGQARLPKQYLVRQDAGGSNEVIVNGSISLQDKIRFTVRNTLTAVPGETAVSAWHDTRWPALPKFTGAVVLPDLSLRLSWSKAAVVDLTPNDPLDRPMSEETLTATVGSEKIVLPPGSTTLTIPPRQLPYGVSLHVANEWGWPYPDPVVTFATMTAGLRIDPLGTFRSGVSFDILAGAKSCSTCAYDTGGAVISYLQSRIDASQPWKTVGRYSGQGEQFDGGITTYGGLQYRVYIPASAELSKLRNVVTAPSSTTARYSATQANFIVAGFNTLNAQVGQIIKATVRIQPEPTLKASLQWWDGKVWHHAAYIPLTKGRGTLTLKAAGRGTTRYWRVAVPKMSYYGKPIVATGSRAFKLKVS